MNGSDAITPSKVDTHLAAARLGALVRCRYVRHSSSCHRCPRTRIRRYSASAENRVVDQRVRRSASIGNDDRHARVGERLQPRSLLPAVEVGHLIHAASAKSEPGRMSAEPRLAASLNGGARARRGHRPAGTTQPRGGLRDTGIASLSSSASPSAAAVARSSRAGLPIGRSIHVSNNSGSTAEAPKQR